VNNLSIRPLIICILYGVIQIHMHSHIVNLLQYKTDENKFTFILMPLNEYVAQLRKKGVTVLQISIFVLYISRMGTIGYSVYKVFGLGLPIKV